jgi:hypothetical protein
MNRIKHFIIAVFIVAWPFLAMAVDSSETNQVKNQTSDQKSTGKADVQQKGEKVKTPTPADKTSKDILVYKPPLRGSPAGRVGGGTRGATERESFSLMVLSPDHIGLTTQEQPCLYWFISKPILHPVELTVIEKNVVNPLLEKVITCPERGGIQGFCLADYGVRLRRNVQYKWFVTIVTDPEHRSKDILAGGMISLVDAPPSLHSKLKEAISSKAPYIYAEEGLWYDALRALSGMIDKSPGDADLRNQRAALLEQVGLVEPAEFEKNL